MNSMDNEILKINGNEILDDKYSYGGDFQGETKILCTQFLDRIEFVENGVIRIIQVTDSGSLKLSDAAIFFKIR